MAFDPLANRRKQRRHVFPPIQWQTRGSNTALSSSTTKATSPPSILDDVVDGDVDGVIAVRPCDFVGSTFVNVRAVQGLRHIDHLIGGRVHIRRFNRQDGPGEAIRAIGCTALASGLVGLPVDILEGLEGNILR